MAVYQISKIQIRRGQANQGTGLPQLASGEMAWAIDTQELYIGNGSVGEGAPAVGNTKVLTSNDLSSQAGLINTIYYTYEVLNTSIQTGASVNTPVSRTLQARLDDQTNLNNFITPADIASGDYTSAIQRAINQLFLNTNSGIATSTVSNRVRLVMPAGTYKTSNTLYIPSYATIEGAGSEKTVINYIPSPVLPLMGNTTNNSLVLTNVSNATFGMLGATISGTNIPANATIPGQIITDNSTITGTTLTIGTLISGTITPGLILSGPGIIPNTIILANIDGIGSGSAWTVNQNYNATTPTNQTVTGTGVVLSGTYIGSITVGTGLYLGEGLLTATSVISGNIQIGQLITGTGIATGTYITGFINANNIDGATSWTVSISQTVASTTISGAGIVTITSPATATSSGSITFSVVTNGPALQAVCDINGAPGQITQTTSDNQPSYISLKGLTIQTNTGSNTCLQLDAVKNSVFEDLKLKGGNTGVSPIDTLSTGIALNAFSSLLTCENNIFKDVKFDNFTFAVYSYQDILNNIFDNCHIKNSYQGFTLGYQYYDQFNDNNYRVSPIGDTLTYGSRQTQIINCKFYNVYKRAVFLGLGFGNTVTSPKLILVGNSLGGASLPTVPQIYFNSTGNTVENVYSDRTSLLNSNVNIYSPYIPETAGWITNNTFGVASNILISYNGAATTTVGSLVLGQTYTIASLGTTNNTQWNTIAGTASQAYLAGSQFVCANVGTGLGNGTVYTPRFAFRLPVATDESGNPNGSATYTIDYSYVSTVNNFVRRGTMTIGADVHNIGGTNYIYPLQLSDEFDFGGADAAYANSLQLDFSAVYLDSSGFVYNSADAAAPNSIQIQYNNLLSGDAGSFTYTYSVIFTKPY
jgi:hypothetical protein